MLDTMTFTKVVGSFCGALLIFLLGKWAGEELYHVGHQGYGEAEQAYIIDTGEEEVAEEAVAEEEVDLATLLTTVDASRGERVFGKCRACHKVEDGANGTGPHLYNVVGREIGAVEGFGYSGALTEVAEVWTPENLNAFLENPRGWAPGTAMSFAGLRDPEERAELIAWLDTIGN